MKNSKKKLESNFWSTSETWKHPLSHLLKSRPKKSTFLHFAGSAFFANFRRIFNGKYIYIIVVCKIRVSFYPQGRIDISKTGFHSLKKLVSSHSLIFPNHSINISKIILQVDFGNLKFCRKSLVVEYLYVSGYDHFSIILCSWW